MKRSVWSRTVVGAAAATLMVLGSTSVRAEEDPLGLKISNAISKDRFFVRAGGIFVKVRTKSGDTYDVTGPVLTKSELARDFSLAINPNTGKYAATGQFTTASPNGTAGVTPESQKGIQAIQGNAGIQRALFGRTQGPNGINLLLDAMQDAGIESIGTPKGVKSEADKNMATGGFSLGFYFSDDFTWVLEAYVLAAPLRTSAAGRGRTFGPDLSPDGGTDPIDRPMLIDGQKIVNTKLLPPTVFLGRYWGDKANKFRPYTGLLATYAIFYDTKATDFLNRYVGGQNPGDTTASIKNTFGIGPVGGFKYQATDDWHVSFNMGYTRLKTEATIVTRNTFFTSTTGASYDLGDTLSSPILAGNSANAGTNATGTAFAANGGLTGVVTRVVSANRANGQNLGTYVRKTELTLDNTLFFLSAGRSF